MEFLPPALEAYAERHSSPEPAYLQALQRETHAETDLPQMLSGHLQGRVLALFSQLLRPKAVLELGTFTGYSALCFAEGLAEGGVVHTIDVDPDAQARALRFAEQAGMADRIHFHLGRGQDVVPSIPGSFDLVFLDADKEGYPGYFDLVVDRVRPGGLIIADNVLWSGKVLDPAAEQDSETAALAAYARKVATDPRVETVLLPVRDGLLVARKIG